MSKLSTSIVLAVASVAILAGCDKPAETTTPATPGTSNMSKVAEAAKDTATAVTDKANETAAAAGEKVADAADKAKEVAADGAAALTKQAEEIYTKAKAAIEGGKIEDAKPLLEQLTKLQDKLPPEWQTKVKELVEMAKTKGVDAAKDAAKSLIPGAK
jgi:phage shock protein A